MGLNTFHQKVSNVLNLKKDHYNDHNKSLSQPFPTFCPFFPQMSDNLDHMTV